MCAQRIEPDTFFRLKAALESAEKIIEDQQLLINNLKKNETVLKNILANSPVVVWYLDENRCFTFSDGKGLADIGLKPGQVVGTNAVGMYAEHPQIVEGIQKTYEGTPQNWIVEVEGNVFDSYTMPDFDEEGNVKGIVAVATNITKRVMAEKELSAAKQTLRRTEERLSSAFYLSPDAIAINRRKDGVYLDVNRAFCRMTGFEPQEVIGKSDLDINIWADPMDRDRLSEELAHTGEVNNLEAQFRYKDGTLVHGLMSARVMDEGGEESLIVIVRDITERKRMEEALRLSEEKFSRIFDLCPDAISISKPDGTYIEANDGFYKATGYKREEVIGKSALDLQIWADPEDRFKAIKGLESDGEVINLDSQFRRKDGTILNGLMSARLFNIQGENRFVAITRDITRLKEIEQTLRASEQKFSTFFSLIPDTVAVAKSDGTILEVNERFEKQHGFTKEEVIGSTALELGIWANPADREPMMEELFSRGVVLNQDFRLKKKDGSTVDVLFSARLFDLHDERYYIAMTHDITERKQMEDALRISEKKFHTTFEVSPYCITINRKRDGLFLDVNQEFTHVTGYSREDTVGKTSGDIGIWADYNDRHRMLDELEQKGWVSNMETRLRRKDGQLRNILMSVRPVDIGGEECYMTAVQDVTERVLAAEALRTSNAKLSLAAELSNVGPWEYDPETNLYEFGDAFYAIYGTDVAREGRFMSPSVYAREFVHPEDAWIVADNIKKLHSSRSVVLSQVQHRIIRRDGQERTIVVWRRAIRDDSGKLLKVYGANQDITERVLAAEALQASNAKLSLAAELSALGPWEYNPDTDLFEFGDAFYAIYDTDVAREGRFMSSAVYAREFVHPEDAWLVADSIKKLNSSLNAALAQVQHRIIRRDGQERTIVVWRRAIRDDSGKLLKVYGANQDITERKQMEDALRASEQKFSRIFSLCPDAISITGSDGTYIEVNEGFTKITGYEKEEIIGNSSLKLRLWADPDDRARMMEELESQGGVFNLQAQFRRKNGTFLTGLLSSKMINIDDKACHVSITRDITELKEMEQILRASEQKFSTFFSLIPDAFLVAKMDGTILESNSYFLKQHGYTKEEVIGKTALELDLWANPRDRRLMMKELLLKGEVANQDFQLRKQDGSTIDVLFSARLFEIHNELCYIAMTRNITERKQIEATLRLSEEKFSKIFHLSPDAISISDADGCFVDVNPSFLKNTGFSREEVIGKTGAELGIWQSAQHRERLIERLQESAPVINYEVQTRNKNGSISDVLMSVRKINVGNEQQTMMIGRDITERKRTEEQLKHLSLHDALTGLYNRAYFEDHMHRMQRASAGTVGLVICDVDGLKIINDTLGHNTGDIVLQKVAQILRKSFRREDIISRIGGDEFTVVLSSVTPEELIAASHRLEENVKTYNDENPTVLISLSIGYAMARDASITMDDLFKEADNNMYREKLHRQKSIRSAIVNTLMEALEARDFMTEGHGERMQQLVQRFASTIGIPRKNMADLRLFAQFHDIGKVGIPDSILFKPGPLSEMEQAVMRTHSEIGYRITMAAPDLAPISDWTLKHHEWWNGNGYPLGLKTQDIPLMCRILSIVDAYDAMTNDRPYRAGMSHEAALLELKRCAGIQFDPELVDKFVSMKHFS